MLALSNIMAKVGDTTMSSKARTPVVPFCTNSHVGAAGAARASDTTPRKDESKAEGAHIALRSYGMFTARITEYIVAR